MKNMLAILAVGLFSTAAFAQLGVPSTLYSASTAPAAVASTNALAVGKVGQVAIELTVVGATAAVTNAITVTVERSLDNANWYPGATLSVTPTGTSTARALTNLAVGAVPYWRTTTIDNSANDTNATITIKLHRKDGI